MEASASRIGWLMAGSVRVMICVPIISMMRSIAKPTAGENRSIADFIHIV